MAISQMAATSWIVSFQMATSWMAAASMMATLWIATTQMAAPWMAISQMVISQLAQMAYLMTLSKSKKVDSFAAFGQVKK